MDFILIQIIIYRCRLLLQNGNKWVCTCVKGCIS